VKIYVAAVQDFRKKEKQDETQLPTNLVEKLVWVPVISLKISFPVICLMSYYAETGRSRP
jgi:hypothetical protein